MFTKTARLFNDLTRLRSGKPRSCWFQGSAGEANCRDFSAPTAKPTTRPDGSFHVREDDGVLSARVAPPLSMTYPRRARTVLRKAVTRSETSRMPMPGLSCNKRLVRDWAIPSSMGRPLIDRSFEQLLHSELDIFGYLVRRQWHYVLAHEASPTSCRYISSDRIKIETAALNRWIPQQ
jgi:hypothetical protein